MKRDYNNTFVTREEIIDGASPCPSAICNGTVTGDKKVADICCKKHVYCAICYHHKDNVLQSTKGEQL